MAEERMGRRRVPEGRVATPVEALEERTAEEEAVSGSGKTGAGLAIMSLDNVAKPEALMEAILPTLRF